MYLETDRLILRRMTAEDFEDFYEYAPDPERCRMMGTAPLRSRKEALEAFQWLLFNEKRFYAIVLREENKVVGHIEVQNYPEEGVRPELAGKTGRVLSFCVSRAYQRRGYAAEALRALIGYLFESRGVDYIVSGYFDFNGPSAALHRKLGFQVFAVSDVPLPDGARARATDTILLNPSAPPAYRGEVSEK